MPEPRDDGKAESARELLGDRVGLGPLPATGHSQPLSPVICNAQPPGSPHKVQEDLDMGVLQKTGSTARKFQKHAKIDSTRAVSQVHCYYVRIQNMATPGSAQPPPSSELKGLVQVLYLHRTDPGFKRRPALRSSGEGGSMGLFLLFYACMPLRETGLLPTSKY